MSNRDRREHRASRQLGKLTNVFTIKVLFFLLFPPIFQIDLGIENLDKRRQCATCHECPRRWSQTEVVIAAAEAKAAKEFADGKEAEYQAAMAEYNKTINYQP